MADFVYGNAAGYDYANHQPEEGYTYDHVFLGLYTLIFTHAAALTICSLVSIRRRNDPARTAFFWHKIGVMLLLIGLLFATITWAIMSYIDSRIINTTRRFSFAKAFIQASNLYRLFFAWSNAVVLVTLVELGLGIYSVVCSNLKLPHMILRYGGFAASTSILVLSAVKYGIVAYLNRDGVTILKDIFKGSAIQPTEIPFAAYPAKEVTHDQLRVACLKLDMVCEVVSFVGALAIVGFAVVTMGKAKDRLSATSIHVVASSLYLLRCIWRFTYAMIFLRAQVWVTPLFVEILDALLDRWALVCIMSIVYIIGIKKQNGLFAGGKSASLDQERG